MKNKNILHAVIKVAFVAILLFFIFQFAGYISENDHLVDTVNQWGYLAAFGVALVSGFNFVIPIPAAAFLPVFITAGLNIYIVVLILALGLTLADSIAYLVGNAGKNLLSDEREKKLADLFESLQNKNSWLLPLFIILYASFVPVPNEVIVVPLAFVGYKFKYIFPLIFIGNFVFNILAVWGIYQFI